MDDDARREADEKERLGLAAMALRRIRRRSRSFIVKQLGISLKRVSEIETGKAASSKRLGDYQAALNYESVHTAKLLDVLEFLGEEERLQPVDPLALTPEQELALYEGQRTLSVFFDQLIRGNIRRKNRDAALRSAAEQWKPLVKLDPARRRTEVRQRSGLHTWAFCVFLCLESVRQAVRDPREAIRIARLAVVVARRVDLPWAGRLVAFALAHLANAFRVKGRHDKAERLFDHAHRLWDAPGMDAADPGVLDPGRILDLEASLRKDQRRLPEALALLQRALPISHKPGRILLSRAIVLNLIGSYEEALKTLARADELLGKEREPRDEFNLNINAGVNLCHLERFDEAAAFAKAAARIAKASGNRLDHLRSLWLKARVHAGRDERAAAFEDYQKVRHDFEGLDMPYDLALVSLELATLLLSLGRTRDCKALAVGLPSYFEGKNIHEEALAALWVFAESARAEAVTEALAREVTDFLYLARGNPGLRFEPAGS